MTSLPTILIQHLTQAYIHIAMMKTNHGRLLTLDREPVYRGFITIAVSDKGFGVFKAEGLEDLEVHLHEPLILEESDRDRVIVVERVEGVPPVAFFCQR